MKQKYLLKLIALLACLCLILSGCGSEQGTSEEASEAVPESAETAPNSSDSVTEELIPNSEPDVSDKEIALEAAVRLLNEKRAGDYSNSLYSCGFADMNLDGTLEFIVIHRYGTDGLVYPAVYSLVGDTYAPISAFECNSFDDVTLHCDRNTKKYRFFNNYYKPSGTKDGATITVEIFPNDTDKEDKAFYSMAYKYKSYEEGYVYEYCYFDDSTEKWIIFSEEEYITMTDELSSQLEPIDFNTYFFDLSEKPSPAHIVGNLGKSYSSFRSSASPFTASSTTSAADFIFPDSNHRYLTNEDVKGLTKEEIRIAKNELYARRGRLFDSHDLQIYFNLKDWYNGSVDPKDFNDENFNDYEKKNAAFLDDLENH